MNLESIREYCLSFPHATEMIQWGDHLLFKVGGKMFAITSLEPQDVVLSFKATPDHFFEFQEREGVIPAPYMARNQWLALERFDVLRDDELRDLLAISYGLVFEKLPKRLQQSLATGKRAGTKGRKGSDAKASRKGSHKKAKSVVMPSAKSRKSSKKKTAVRRRK